MNSMVRVLRWSVLSLVALTFPSLFSCGDKEEEPVVESGRHVRVRAPYTRVDVWVPDDRNDHDDYDDDDHDEDYDHDRDHDDDDDVDVDVDVDD